MVEKKKVKKKKPAPLKGEAALKLARKGPEAWNEWAEKNPGREVSFQGIDFTLKENEKISFEGFTFPGRVFFSKTTFGTTNFEKAVFRGQAHFIKAVFKEHARFQEAVFKDVAYFAIASFGNISGFSRATFENYTVFGGAVFVGAVEFKGSQFRVVPDFRATDFQKHLSLHGMEIIFQREAEDEDADMYRRLKELAVNARDHDREQMFFAYELIAKRGYETHGLRLIPNYLYEFLGDFGRNLTLPCFWLSSVWFMFGIFYRWLETAKPTNHFSDGLSFSAAQLLPFLGASKGALSDARVAL